MSLRFSAAFALVFASNVALAQGNFRATPTGGRSALMGGTGVALGTDGAAPFLNPATLVRIDSLLSVSVNLLAAEVSTVDRFHSPGAIDPSFGNLQLQNTNITKASLQAVPSTLCVYLNAPKLGSSEGDQGKQKLGICFGTIERDSFDYIGRGYRGGIGRQTTEVQSLARNWSRFVLAPTYAVYLGDHVAFGASMQAVFSNANAIVSQTTATHGAGAGVITTSHASGLDANAFGLSPIFGLTVRSGAWTFGTSFQTADLTLVGDAHVSEASQSAGAATRAQSYVGKGGFRATAPWRFSLGVGRELAWGTVELNAGFGIPHETMLEAKTAGTVTTADGAGVMETMGTKLLEEQRSALMHVGLGAEWFPWSRSLSFLGGVAGSFTFNDAPGGILPTRQTRGALSLGLGSHGEGGDLLIGVELSYERGRTLAANGYAIPPRSEPVGMDGFRALFVLAGSTSLKAIGRAVTDVVIDPVKREQERIRQREREKQKER